MNYTQIGIVGSGAMGSGIAQVAATAGCTVFIFDSKPEASALSEEKLKTTLNKLEAKGKIDSASAILDRIKYVRSIEELAPCDLVIEAIVEHLEVKKEVFRQLEQVCKEDCILATNTSSLSVASVASACQGASRVLGIHFFNPAPLMPLVEIIPAIQTREGLAEEMKSLMADWGKSPVIAKDTPGFIVNRIARPFYGEAMRIAEENLAQKEDIDAAMKMLGFRMGPFELMDYIGHDVNYVVTATVFESFYYDSRYKPSLMQKRLLEAGWLGRKSGRGFYNYEDGQPDISATLDADSLQKIAHRVLAMLINEAVDALYLKIATDSDIEMAMTKGVNYPKGLLAWCDELGADYILAILDQLFELYREDRYRASPLLRKAAIQKQQFLTPGLN